MKRALIALGIVSKISAGFGQTPDKPLAFEVAMVKASTDVGSGTHDRSTPGTLWERNQTLRDLIQLAFNVKDYQVSGGPKWIASDRYDIDGKANFPAKDPELFRMLQTLLEERFKLAVHRETKPYTGYALVVVKGGFKMKPVVDTGHPTSNSHNGTLVATSMPLARFTQWLARRLDGPVVDATGVSAVFDFKLEFSEARSPAPATDPADAKSPPLLTALEEQLGLKLEPRKVPVEMIVVDRAEKPVEN